MYFREVAVHGDNFGYSFGIGGVIAFSRILVDREVLVIANTGGQPFTGSVILDRDLNATPHRMTIAHSNLRHCIDAYRAADRFGEFLP